MNVSIKQFFSVDKLALICIFLGCIFELIFPQWKINYNDFRVEYIYLFNDESSNIYSWSEPILALFGILFIICAIISIALVFSNIFYKLEKKMINKFIYIVLSLSIVMSIYVFVGCTTYPSASPISPLFGIIIVIASLVYLYHDKVNKHN